ncbi:hypothetical protein D3C87_1802300 [compost metagenome]
MDSEKDIPSSAIREFHSQHLKKASEVLQTAPVEKRDFTTMTIPVNVKHLKKAKKYIADFQDRMALLLSEGDTTEVYDLTIQLFPLTHPKGK